MNSFLVLTLKTYHSHNTLSLLIPHEYDGCIIVFCKWVFFKPVISDFPPLYIIPDGLLFVG